MTKALVALAAIVGGAWLGLAQLQPPASAARDGVAARFSIERARTHVDRIATEPHPAGSAAAARVRDYLRDALRAMELSPIDQQATMLRPTGRGRYTWVPVQNVIARVPGRQSSGAVLLVAHYDSPASGPGAGDNASGVAVLLESARVLRAEQPLEHDVILLFTDAEEAGLLGAELFATRHPWAKDVGVTLNFEARGVAGPSFMFEATPGQDWMIRQMARSVPFPRASSLYYEIYRRLGNDTDLSALRRSGMPGLNFAFVEKPVRYHTSGDTAAAIDRATLYHHGTNAISLAAGFAGAGAVAAPPAAARTDAIYFTIGNTLIVYSPRWMYALITLAVVLLCAGIGLALRQRRLRWTHLLLGVLAAFVAVAASLGAAYGVATYLPRFVPIFRAPGFGLYTNGWYIAGLVLLAATFWLIALAVAGRRATRLALVLGGAIVATAAAVALAWLPGASYLMTWPALAGVAAAGAALFGGAPSQWDHPTREAAAFSWRDTVITALVAWAVALLIAPPVSLLFVGMGMTGGVPASGLAALAFAAIVPSLLVIAGRAPWSTAGLSLLAAVIALTIGIQQTRHDQYWPKQNSVFYAWSADDGKALWATRERRVDAWTTNYLGDAPPRGVPLECLRGAGEFLYRAAPALTVASSDARVTRDETSGDRRLIDLYVEAAAGASLMLVNRSPAESSVALLGAGGESVDPPASSGREAAFASLTMRGVPAEGLAVRLSARPGAPLKIVLLHSVPGFPPGAPAASRSAWMVRGIENDLFNDATLTCRSLALAASPATPVAATVAARSSR